MGNWSVAWCIVSKNQWGQSYTVGGWHTVPRKNTREIILWQQCKELVLRLTYCFNISFIIYFLTKVEFMQCLYDHIKMTTT